MKLKSAFALAVFFATATFARAETPTAAGFWAAKDDDGFTTAWFLFTEKKNVYSARLVKGFKKPGDTAKVETICATCPGDKKGAHIMGLTLFYGMKRQGLEYRGGSVLDPRDGSIYHAQMDLDPDGKTLHVRGYIGVPWLGKTQDWARLPDDTMKKEDIPKEVLADAAASEEAANGSGEKLKHSPEKKPHKVKDKKAAKTDDAAPAPDAEAPVDTTPAK